MMRSEPGQGGFDRLDPFGPRHRRPRDHHHGQAKIARGDQLGARRLAAGILGDDDVDRCPLHERGLSGKIERRPGEQHLEMRQIRRRIGRIDAAQQIMVLRRDLEGGRLKPANGEEDPGRCRAKRQSRAGHIGHLDPAIVGCGSPGRPDDLQQRNASLPGCLHGIGGDARREGMRRIDQKIECLGPERCGKPLDAAKAADPKRQRLGGRRSGASGKRKRRLDPRQTGESAGERSRLTGSSQNEQALHG